MAQMDAGGSPGARTHVAASGRHAAGEVTHVRSDPLAA